MLGYRENRIFAMSADKFTGVDMSEMNKKLLTSAAAMSENMFVNSAGALEKRCGIKSVYTAADGARVNGFYKYSYGDDGKVFFVAHEGSRLYILRKENDEFVKDKLLYEGIADKESKGFLFGGALYIMCGGYYKIEYVEAFACLGICRVCDYHKNETAEQVVVTERRKGVLNGVYAGVINEENRYAKIKFMYDDYCFQYGDGTYDKLYVASGAYSEAVRVVKLMMGEREVEQYHYSVEKDEKGLYIKLSRRNVYIDKVYSCSPEVTVEIGGFVYAPINVASRLAIGISSSGSVIDEHKTRERLTGEYVQDLNSACGLRRVNFYVTASDFSKAAKVRFYLNAKPSYGKVLFVRVGGELIHSYAIQEGQDELKWVVDDFYDYYVDIDKNFLKSLQPSEEYAVEIEYISRCESVIDGCGVYGFYGGANDTRVFLSGNCKFGARDYESATLDGSYFPELKYVTVGDDYSRILGYGRFYSYQLIFKDENGAGSMYFRHMSDEGGYAVKKGEMLRCAVSENGVINVNSDLFILSKDGIFSIESTAIEGQSKCVLRSKEIDGLLKCEDLEKVKMGECDGNLIVLAQRRMYVLDICGGYRWYVYTFPKAVDGVCGRSGEYFLSDGHVMVMKDESDDTAYEDWYSESEKYSVCGYWTTNNVCFGEFDARDILSAYCVTGDERFFSSVTVLYSADDFKNRVAMRKNTDLFGFADMNFARFSFVGTNKGRSVRMHLRAKRVKRFSLTFKNERSEPFKLCEVGFLYR